MMAIQVDGEVVSMRRVGAYYLLSMTAPGIPEITKPGHFIAVSVGGPNSAMLLRRSFSVYKVSEKGLYG
ncbi:MAG: hypothetical protein RL745_435, partial [Actinomycetota bacterium]